MLMKPDAATLRALHAMKGQTGWATIDKYFRDELGRTHARLVHTADAVVIHQLQGRAKLIAEFLELMATAQEQLEKLKHTTL